MLKYFLIIAYVIEINNLQNIEFKIIVTIIFYNIFLYIIFQGYLQINITMLLYILYLLTLINIYYSTGCR